MKICLVTYYNQYESKRYFTARLAEALKRMGVEVLIVDPPNGIISVELQNSIKAFSPNFLFSFNSTWPDPSGKYVADILGIPEVIALVDPAFYAIEMTKSPYHLFTTVDREDCKWLIDNGVKNTFFWPHAVEANPPLAIKKEKIYDVVFLGTCTDFIALQMEWNQKLTQEEMGVLKKAIDHILTPPGTSLIQAIALSISSTPFLDISQIDFKAIFHYLDHYVRGKDRFELIRSIKSAKVHVFGEPSWFNKEGSASWKGYLGDLPNVILHPPVKYDEAFKIMQQAKICLNSTPFFRYGSHERVFNALLSGAVPLTSDNGFIQEFFSPGKDLLTYTIGDWESVNAQVDHFLKENETRDEMTEIGRQKVLKAHTWDVRAGELLTILNKI